MTTKKNRVVTSLRIDSELWKEAKIEAIKRGTNLATLIEQAVKKEITAIDDKNDTKSLPN